MFEFDTIIFNNITLYLHQYNSLDLNYLNSEYLKNLKYIKNISLVKDIDKFINLEDKYNSLISALYKELILSNNSLNIENLKKNRYGKPIIDGLFFNISHTKNCIVCAVSNKFNIGIDVEFVNNQIDINDFRNYLTIDELNIIYKNSNYYINFYDIWTKKEAVIKAYGSNLDDIKNIKIINNRAFIYNIEYDLISLNSYKDIAINIAYQIS